MKSINSNRLDSIDVLRGFDMFFLVGAGDVLRNFFRAFHSESLQPVLYQLDHHWLGFTAWDIIMPLFLFTSGLSMPFSFSGFLGQGHSKAQLYGKIIRRFCILFVLGWIAQGNLLDLNISTFNIYCNTLHSIAFGYLITSLIVLNIKKWKQQLIVGFSLVVVYWAYLSFIPVPGKGIDFTNREINIAQYIDQLLMGHFQDETHQYTWILSSLGFGATVISGYFAGLLLKNKVIAQIKKLQVLAGVGVALVVGGLLWSLRMPIIKPIWSPSMILLASGWCYLLLALSFMLTDIYRFKGWWVKGLKILGMNSIAAYMIFETVWSFKMDVEHLLHGFQQFTGDFFPALVSLGSFATLFAILTYMYKQKIFLKV